ncbi:piercer of microtubule wall 1 protein isoform X2 [Arvicanthis niloticus]
MSEEKPQECAEPGEPKAKPAPEKTSDYYRISEKLPIRFNNPAWFHGYRTNEAVSMYRTSNQTYGSRAPTVHEMPRTRKGARNNLVPKPGNFKVPWRPPPRDLGWVKRLQDRGTSLRG